MSDLYTAHFFAAKDAGRAYAARQVMDVIARFLQPHAVADFGCGTGIWLNAAADIGAQSLHGFDGPWISQSDLDSRIKFTQVDLEAGASPAGTCNLAICLEVAEHLTPAAGTRLIKTLCSVAPVVLFSAAIPAQGGTNHINEQWQSYWADEFAANGFDCFDPIRPEIWSDRNVFPWYRQNILLFVSRSADKIDRTLIGSPIPARDASCVHPEMFEHVVARLSEQGRITLRRLMRNILHALPGGAQVHAWINQSIRKN